MHLKVPFVEDLLVIGTASSYIDSPFQKSKFWQGAEKGQSLVQSAFTRGRAACPRAIEEFRLCPQCPVLSLLLQSSSRAQEGCGGR